MDQPTLDSTAPVRSKVFVRELVGGVLVGSPFLVRDVTRRQKRNGDSFRKLQLGDVTGAVEAVVWAEVDEAARAARPGGVVSTRGAFIVSARCGPRPKVRPVRPAADGEYDPA